MGDECAQQGRITLGENVYVGPYSYLGSCHNLSVGDDTLIGAYSYLITVNHSRERPGVAVASQGFRGGDITIGRNVWLGCHVVILPGVVIGDEATIGAGAVVTKSVPPGETWGGVPAKPLVATGGVRCT